MHGSSVTCSLSSAPPRRHTVPEVSEEMKSLIIEKNKAGLEEEAELLVKGESHPHTPRFHSEPTSALPVCDVNISMTHSL